MFVLTDVHSRLVDEKGRVWEGEENSQRELQS